MRTTDIRCLVGWHRWRKPFVGATVSVCDRCPAVYDHKTDRLIKMFGALDGSAVDGDD